MTSMWGLGVDDPEREERETWGGRNGGEILWGIKQVRMGKKSSCCSFGACLKCLRTRTLRWGDDFGDVTPMAVSLLCPLHQPGLAVQDERGNEGWGNPGETG